MLGGSHPGSLLVPYSFWCHACFGITDGVIQHRLINKGSDSDHEEFIKVELVN